MPVFNESETPRHRTQQQAPWTRQVSRECSHSDRTHASPLSRRCRDTRTLDCRTVCELERERAGIRDDEHRLTEEADERRLLLLEEERLRLIEEKELVRLMEAERKAFIADQRRGHEAEVKELVVKSNTMLHLDML